MINILLQILLVVVAILLYYLSNDNNFLIDIKQKIFNCNNNHNNNNDINLLLKDGMKRFSKNVKTLECQHLVEEHLLKHIYATTLEGPYPFEDVSFQTQCPTARNYSSMPQSWFYKHNLNLPVNNDNNNNNNSYVDNHNSSNNHVHEDNLSICYIMLTHNHPRLTLRIIRTLLDDDIDHTIIIHVDKDEDNVYSILQQEIKNDTSLYQRVLLVPNNKRVSVIWGGFSVVQAMLNAMEMAMQLRNNKDNDNRHNFQYLAAISGSTYPLRSNKEIRRVLSKDTSKLYMDIKPRRVIVGLPESWNYFVECDKSLHRVARLTIPRGIDMFLGSQWWILPISAINWLLNDPLSLQYAKYCQHVVVADENFFATLFKNSPFCSDIQNTNLLYLHFDRWENGLEQKKILLKETNGDGWYDEKNYNNIIGKRRSDYKCVNRDPNQCGRSPTTLTTDYANYLAMSRALFARKFDPTVESSISMLDKLDEWRKVEQKIGELDQVENKQVKNDVRPIVSILKGSNRVMITQKYPTWLIHALVGYEYQFIKVAAEIEGLEDISSSSDSSSSGSGRWTKVAYSGPPLASSYLWPLQVRNTVNELITFDLEMQSVDHMNHRESVRLKLLEELKQYRLCVELSQGQMETVRLAPCDPVLDMQWLHLGPCVDGDDTITDFSGKQFHHQNDVQGMAGVSQRWELQDEGIISKRSTHTINAATSRFPPKNATTSNEEYPMCFITRYQASIQSKADDYVFKKSSSVVNRCLDVQGEEVDEGSPLVYYECTGNWNQLFSPLPDGSISVTRPGLISQLRRKDLQAVNETFCLQSRLGDGGIISLVTAVCGDDDDIKFSFILGDNEHESEGHNENYNKDDAVSGQQILKALAPQKMSLEEAAADGRATLEAQRRIQRRKERERDVDGSKDHNDVENSGRGISIDYDESQKDQGRMETGEGIEVDDDADADADNDADRVIVTRGQRGAPGVMHADTISGRRHP